MDEIEVPLPEPRNNKTYFPILNLLIDVECFWLLSIPVNCNRLQSDQELST